MEEYSHQSHFDSVAVCVVGIRGAAAGRLWGPCTWQNVRKWHWNVPKNTCEEEQREHSPLSFFNFASLPVSRQNSWAQSQQQIFYYSWSDWRKGRCPARHFSVDAEETSFKDSFTATHLGYTGNFLALGQSFLESSFLVWWRIMVVLLFGQISKLSQHDFRNPNQCWQGLYIYTSCLLALCC